MFLARKGPILRGTMSTFPHRTVLAAGLAIAILIVATPLHADEADDQFAVAAGHYDSQRWKLAVEEFQKFQEKYPGDQRMHKSVFYLGEAMIQLGKVDEARDHFRKYIGLEPDGKHAKPAMFRAAEAAYLASNFDAAKPELEAFLKKYSNDRLNAYVLPYLGDIALAKDDMPAAVGYFREGLKRFPDGKLQDDCRFGLGRALEKQNQLEEAERLYLAVAGKPGSLLADASQFHLGALHYAAGRYDQALESFAAFEDRLATSAWQPNARLGQGSTLLKLNRPAEAIKPFDAVLATPSIGDELLQQALRGKVQAALQLKDYAGVDRDAGEFEKRFPRSSLGDEVRRMLARSLVERKDYAQAVALLEPLASSNHPGQPGLENHYLLAVSYEGLKRYDDALAALLPVVDVAAGQLKADVQLTLGSLFLAQKKYADAIGPLEAFVQGKPTGDTAAKALGELAICYARTGQLDKAKTLYAELVEKYPQHAVIAPTTEHLAEAAYDANDAAWSAELSGRLTVPGNSAEYELKGKLGLGWSQFKAGKLPEAAVTFEDVLKGNPPEAVAAEASLIRGRILEQLGQSEPALALYDQLIEKHPGSKQHVDALLAAARLRAKLKQNDQAATLYERLARDYPQFAKLDAVIYEWAWALQELGKPEEAGRLFDRLRKEFPQSRFWADATCRLAQRAFDAKDYDAATKLLDEVLNPPTAAVGPASPTEPKVREYAMFLRGQIIAAKLDWPNVREAFEAMLKEFPETQRRLIAEFWVAEAFYRQADYAAAGPRLEQLAQQIKDQREPWMAMIPLRHAQVLAQQNQWTDAYAIATKIPADFANFGQQYEVDYLLGRCLANQANFEAARQAYGRVINSPSGAKTETAAMAQFMIGESFFHQKNYEAAYREFLKVDILYAFPIWQAGALLQAGKCHELLGEGKQAIELYQRILKNYPNTTFSEQAAQRLKNPKKTASPE